MADSVRGPPVPNMTDGAETGDTRANYAGLGDVSLLLSVLQPNMIKHIRVSVDAITHLSSDALDCHNLTVALKICQYSLAISLSKTELESAICNCWVCTHQTCFVHKHSLYDHIGVKFAVVTTQQTAYGPDWLETAYCPCTYLAEPSEPD